ncbi:MAG TPA: RidA family protein [Nitrososphaerales archaeon]|nr:RidA family protein [Nitrososphaerales archaeon]
MSESRINIASGGHWETIVGYSRAVRIGNIIVIAGTTATDSEGKVIGVGDAYTQTKVIFEKIGRALNEAGASFKDVIRTRIYTTDISKWNEIGKAHGETFSHIKPAATMVEVRKLIVDEAIVEIEAEAVMNPSPAAGKVV